VLAYVDTSALIALAVSSDKNHGRALTFLRTALSDGTRFVLGRPALIEYIGRDCSGRLSETRASHHP